MKLHQQLHLLEVECFNNPYPVEQINSILLNRQYLILLIDEKQQIIAANQNTNSTIAGYLIAFQQEADNLSELHRIGILPSYRQSNLGFSLLSYYFEVCQNSKIYRLLLEVASKNVAAQRLYQKAGYRSIGLRKNYYPDGDSAIIYEKITAIP
ncbi:MAG: GNAT family N-acetyltransferase [Leptonema sp. (in: Bacteria)]|nr:GNAT family N-acetyltransferase [Leptonema sp. (in: bacteria)]